MNPPSHRFCGACGASLVGDHEPAVPRPRPSTRLERPAGSSAVAFVGRDDELRRLAAVHEAAVAARGRILTWNHRGRVDVSRQLGTMRDGGPFEHVFVRVFMTGGPHIRRYEFFDAADTERALARFAELCRAES